MAPRSKGPRLFLKRGIGRRPVWFIRHGMQMYSTGCYEEEKPSAETILAAYCNGGRYETERGKPGYVTRPDTVYFITCEAPDFPVKIGVASDVATRVKALSVAMPYPVFVLATISGGIDQERLFHMQFAEHRLQGEWFKRTPELMELIQVLARRPRE